MYVQTFEYPPSNCNSSSIITMLSEYFLMLYFVNDLSAVICLRFEKLPPSKG